MVIFVSEEIQQRKLEHLGVCINQDIEYKKTTGLEDVELKHYSAPEIDFDDVDCSCEFFGKKMNAPFVIEAITFNDSRRLNSSSLVCVILFSLQYTSIT